MTHAAAKSVAAGEPELIWSHCPRLCILSSNARHHLAAKSCSVRVSVVSLN